MKRLLTLSSIFFATTSFVAYVITLKPLLRAAKKRPSEILKKYQKYYYQSKL